MRRRTKRGFFVRSTELSICPCCEKPFEKVSGSRPRIWYRSSGDRNKLIIRRLYCEQCEQIHHIEKRTLSCWISLTRLHIPVVLTGRTAFRLRTPALMGKY
ncbi:DUF6431 domain-containing protein [Lentibacillus salicampi]|uniref:DUF6431 domain-containing protein n=1 Tax=Lentibacillus salicampi TaxID=175306 RepID=UPI003CC90A47